MSVMCDQLSGLDEELALLEPALRESLDRLYNPQYLQLDKGELYMLLEQSGQLSEFHSLVRDVEATLNEVLDSEEDMADMYLTHYASTG